MKHCIIMTAYKDVGLINKIIESAPDNFDFYIHLDKKCQITPSDISPRANVFKKYKIFWGSIEHLKAFLFLLSKAYGANRQYDFYHLITGQDYICCPLSRIDDLLKLHTSYLDCFDLPQSHWWMGGLHILQYRTLASFDDVRKPYMKVLDKSYQFFQQMFHLTRKLPSYKLYGGSVYCSLSEQAVKYCLESELAKDMIARLNNSTCGEEVFFQTVLMNSPLRDTIVTSNLRYIDWSVPNGPKVLVTEDVSNVIKSHNLFCRKVDRRLSKDFLVSMNEYINQ